MHLSSELLCSSIIVSREDGEGSKQSGTWHQNTIEDTRDIQYTRLVAVTSVRDIPLVVPESLAVLRVMVLAALSISSSLLDADASRVLLEMSLTDLNKYFIKLMGKRGVALTLEEDLKEVPNILKE